jgi:transcriptional regulator with PAS, ATPase and Fis domain
VNTDFNLSQKLDAVQLRIGGQIALPPLRDRLDDIQLLAEAFVRDAERTHHSALWRSIGDDAIEALA